MARALVDEFVAAANQAYRNSEVDLRLHLTRATEVDYEETADASLDLSNLKTADDGFMDSVHAWRDDTRSDIVHLLVADSNYGGLGYLIPPKPAFAGQAFALSRYDYTEFTFAHEIGHNLGLMHDRHTFPDGSAATNYAHGYINPAGLVEGADASRRWRTVMATSSHCNGLGIRCPRLQWFSNPRHTYLGDPIGIPTDNGRTGADGPADASGALNEGRTGAACFRVAAHDLIPGIHLPDRNLRPDAPFDVELQLANRCAAAGPATDGTVHRSLDSAIDPKDTVIARFTFGAASGGQTAIQTMALRAPTGPGTYYFGTCVRAAGTASGADDICSDAVGATVEAHDSLRLTGLYDGRVDENESWTSTTPVVEGADGTVTWSASGADAGLFTIDPGTGVVTLPPQDYEAPADADRNNAYEVTVVATDAGGRRGERFITVRVRDVDDESGGGGGGLDFHNTPPVVERQISDQAVDAGATLDLDIRLNFYDRDERSLDYSVEISNPAVAGVEVDRHAKLTIHGIGGGVAVVTVTASDDEGARVSQRFRVAVRGPALVAWFPRADDPVLEGFVRLVNHSERAGEVSITAIDDRGKRAGPVSQTVEAGAVAHLNAGDLEGGNPAKGLSGALGSGEGDWRLAIEAGIDIEALAYVRTADGFLTAIDEVAPARDGTHRIATFNPGSNPNQVSRLRLVNRADEYAEVGVTGIDDAGRTPARSRVYIDLPPRHATTLTAAELESGAGVDGALGDGDGKWRLLISSNRPVVAMSLLENPTGHLTNLSTVAPAPVSAPRLRPTELHVHAVPLFPSASDPYGRQGVVRVANHSGTDGEVRIHAHDDAGSRYHEVTLALDAWQTVQFNSNDLELGGPDKGLQGNTGPGNGAWRLELSTDLDIEVLSYVRTADGFLTAMHDLAPAYGGAHWVPTFNPGSNPNQVSALRLVNPGAEHAEIEIEATDDRGRLSRRAVALTVPPGASRTVTAQELETGGDGLDGALGDGTGKWRLWVRSESPIAVLSLISNRTAHLTNLSGGEGRRHR